LGRFNLVVYSINGYLLLYTPLKSTAQFLDELMKMNIQDRLDQLPAKGVWSAALTPLNVDLSIDRAHLNRHAKFLLDNGCHGIGLFGTTGEANAFSVSERMTALESLLAAGFSPDVLMIGTGCCALTDTVALTRHAIDHGVTKILALPPFYYKNVTDSGLFRSFEEMIDRTASDKLKLYLYHFPVMSQTPISANLIAMLCDRFPTTIAGVKDSSGDLEHTLELASHFPSLAIFPGNETHLLAALQKGCAGCISATANANPLGIRKIFDSCLTGNKSTQALQDDAFAIREVFGRHPLVSALKQHAAWLTGDDSWLRLRPPLTALEKDAATVLRTDLDALAVSPR
jgi:4-hydroxy-tetrahydrodipicolinate synthase